MSEIEQNKFKTDHFSLQASGSFSSGFSLDEKIAGNLREFSKNFEVKTEENL